MLLTLKEVGVDDPVLARHVSEIYLQRAPKKTNVFPVVHETLEYLSERYQLHILTNGFAEVQVQKINNAGLKNFFSKLFMAEMVGYHKPDKRFFEYAIKSVHARKSESLMIGDDPDADIVGAAHAGIDQVYFNHGDKACLIQPTWEIKTFEELKTFL
jgi:putative hydrolase of the HAD superfamily